MKQRWSLKTILKEIVITLAMLFVISLALNYIRKPDVSNQIPDIKVQLIDGRGVNLQEKKPLVLHFWATWCPICKFEAPNLESLKNSGVRIITVAVNSGDNSTLQAFMKANGYSYDVVNDINGDLADKFDVEVFPTTFIYDGNGTLQFAEVGYSTTLGLKTRLKLIEFRK